MDSEKFIPAAWFAQSGIVLFLLRGAAGSLRPVYVTANVHELTGYSVAEALVPGWWEKHLHPEDRARLLARQLEVLDGELLSDDYRFRHRDGHYLWVRAQRRRAPGAADADVIGTWTDITGLKNLEAELKTGAARYHQLFDANPQPMWVYDLETLVFLAVNDAAVAFYGYARDELLGMTIRDIRPEEDVPCLLAHLEKAPASFRSSGEWRHRRKNGEVLQVEVRSHALLFAGRSARMVVVFDLTDRHRAERALRETESSYSSLFESVSDAIYIQDAEGRFLAVNDGAVKMYGYPRERFVGDTPGFLAAPEKNDLGEVSRALARALAGEPQRFEFWGQRSNGEVFPKEVRLFAGTFRGQNVVIALAQDITERKRAEAELRLLREAIEQAGEAILVTDREGNIHYANPAFETVTGYSREEAVGKSTRLLNSGQQSPEFYRDLWDTINSGRTWHGSLVNRRKDGALYSEEESISPVFDDEGRIANYVAVKRDVSARLQLEEQLVQAQKMESVGRLAGGVAHDFNNMLSIVLGYADRAKGRIEPGNPAQEDLNQILLAAERSSDLVRQLLAFARRQPIEPRVLDLNELLGRTGKMLRGLLTEEIELVLDLGADLWSVRADPGQIDQILANLIVNARDAIAGTGRITVATRNVPLSETERQRPGEGAAENVLLSVTDTGEGMDRATLERLFEPFYTTKEAGKGTGLGLATVYGIVQQNHGRIEVESAPGLGASFRIHLPRCAVAPAESTAAIPAASKAKAETILLVEDSSELLDLTAEQLEQLGYQVLATPSAVEAFELVARATSGIDLLLTDVIMPELNGRELANRLRADHPRMRVLFMSGYPADILSERGVVPGNVQFLQKPFDVATLARKIRALLDS